MKKYTLIDYIDIWSDVEKGYLLENVEYSIMASDEYFMEVWHEDMPICALI